MPLSPFACTNCGHWQKYFAVPPHCPICIDVRNDLPENGWEFVTPQQVAPKLEYHWREAIPGVWEFWSTPRFGLDSHGWLLLYPEGNVAFEAAPYYSAGQLAKIRELGGIRVLAASHPHGYGALYQLQEHFGPELLIQKEDLEWTKAMRVTLPYDEVFEIRPGLTLYHTGGHYDGHSILHDRDRKAVFAGDSLKIDFDPDGSAARISCHKAYHKQIPLSRDEARRYRAVYEQLDFTSVFTPFEYATNTSTKAALALFDEVIAGPPFTSPIPDPAMTDHFLPQDLPPAAAAYIASMPPGRVELFSLAPLDRTGVACWNAIFLNEDGTRFHGVTPHGVGYGTTDAEAIIGTTGELAEAVHSAGAIARFPRRTGSYAALSAELGTHGIADPLTLCLPAGSPVDHDTVMEWVPAQRWPSGKSVLVPTEIAGCSVGDFTPGYHPFTTPITNGLGAGPTLDFAIGHGICELLQRDGNGTGFRAMDRGIVLDLGDGPADPRTRALLARLAAQGIEVLPKFASDEFGVAGVYCVGGERDASAPFPIMLTAAGEAASVDREQALRKALFEFAAARVRKMFSHAPLAAIAHIAPPGYLERFRSYHSLSGEESRALREMMAWCTIDAPTLRGYLADTVLSRQATKRFDELPAWDGPLSGTPLVTELARRFADAGMEVLFVDFSPPGARNVHVVKAIVPGLEVETMSYHRIGERGVRKLMQRGSPLVGLGACPPGAAPVRLPAGAAERLGGPAWLDVAAVDRLVGRLYPLYREPEVHSAPIALERRA